MRDGDIYNMNQRRAQADVILSRQLSFLNSRMEAYETVLASRLAVLLAILNPKWLLNAVNAKQAKLMWEHNEKVKEIAAKQKEEQAKPKITIVGANGAKLALAVLAVFMFSGCVTRKYHAAKVAEAYKTGYDQADKECLALQGKIAKYVDSLKNRLAKFNQIDEKGNLKPLKKWTGDTWEDDPNPDAPWMK